MKKGFSLVELLIVLAVIAALIATITPVALNAISKAKATQVTRNITTLAKTFENAVYVNGIVTVKGFPYVKISDDKYLSNTEDLKLLGRDIDIKTYGLWYAVEEGRVYVGIFSNEKISYKLAKEILPSLKYAEDAEGGIPLKDFFEDHQTYLIQMGLDSSALPAVYYLYSFDI